MERTEDGHGLPVTPAALAVIQSVDEQPLDIVRTPVAATLNNPEVDHEVATDV